MAFMKEGRELCRTAKIVNGKWFGTLRLTSGNLVHATSGIEHWIGYPTLEHVIVWMPDRSPNIGELEEIKKQFWDARDEVWIRLGDSITPQRVNLWRRRDNLTLFKVEGVKQ